MVLTKEEARVIAVGVGATFGMSYEVRIFQDATQYKAETGQTAPPTVGWFSARVMRVLLNTFGQVPPGRETAYTKNAIMHLVAHEVGHQVIAPKNALAGYAAMKLLIKRGKAPEQRVLEFAQSGHNPQNVMSDLALDRYMGANPDLKARFGVSAYVDGNLEVAKSFGDDRQHKLIADITRRGSGTFPGGRKKPPYDFGEFWTVFNVLNFFYAMNRKWYTNLRVELTPGERAFDDKLKLLTERGPSMDIQETYDVMVDAMAEMLPLIDLRQQADEVKLRGLLAALLGGP